MGQGGGDWDDCVKSDVEAVATRMRQGALARCAISLLLQIRQARFDDFSPSICPAEAFQSESIGVEGLFDSQEILRPVQQLRPLVLLSIQSRRGQLHASEAWHEQGQGPLVARLHRRATQRSFHGKEPALVNIPGKLGRGLFTGGAMGQGHAIWLYASFHDNWRGTRLGPMREAADDPSGRFHGFGDHPHFGDIPEPRNGELSITHDFHRRRLGIGLLRCRRVHTSDLRTTDEHGVPSLLRRTRLLVWAGSLYCW